MDTKFRCFMEPEVVMRRRKFSREFKIEAVRLVGERGVSAAQAARDLHVHENVLRKWVKEFGSDPVQAFQAHSSIFERSSLSNRATFHEVRSSQSRRFVDT